MKQVRHQKYKMSFSTGGLFLNESLKVARLHINGEKWERTIAHALADVATVLPKAASNRRTLREISNRLMTLTDNELRHFIDANGQRMEQFLEAYNNYDKSNGVWISGFFGSEKSHLLKMLTLLLENCTVGGNRAHGRHDGHRPPAPSNHCCDSAPLRSTLHEC